MSSSNFFDTSEAFIYDADKAKIAQASQKRSIEPHDRRHFILTADDQEEMNRIYDEIENGSTRLVLAASKKPLKSDIDKVDDFLLEHPEYVSANNPS